MKPFLTLGSLWLLGTYVVAGLAQAVANLFTLLGGA